MEQTKYDVFISYSRKDYVDENKNVIPGNEVSKIIDALTKAGISFWFDQEGIKHGEDFGAKILKYIKASKIFVYLSTAAANDSEWTRKEIACAGMYKKMIIPVRIDESPYHDSVMFRIADLEHINYAANPQKGREELVNHIKRYMAEEQRRRDEQERQHRQQEELRRKQQQADNLRAEISKTEEECTTLEKALLLKKHDLDVVNLELDAKHKHLEEQKLQMTAILYDGSTDSEAERASPDTAPVAQDIEPFSFHWCHPFESWHAMRQKMKDTRGIRHWTVNVILWLYLLFVLLLAIILPLLGGAKHQVEVLTLCTLAILTIYAILHLLLNNRAGIGLLLLTPILIFVAPNKFFGFTILALSCVSIFFVCSVCLIRKGGKTAMSLLEGRVVGALQIHKYLICYLALVCCSFIAAHLAEKAFVKEKEKILSDQENILSVLRESTQEKEKALSDRESILSVLRESCGSEIHYQLGKMYYKQEQYEEAIIWYKNALQKNLSRDHAIWAQYRLGTCYEKGLGVKPDTLKAIEWYKKAYDGYPYLSEAGFAYQRLEEELQKNSNK